MCLPNAEKVLQPIICWLSANNRPITDYLKMADYLPINQLIPTFVAPEKYINVITLQVI